MLAQDLVLAMGGSTKCRDVFAMSENQSIVFKIERGK